MTLDSSARVAILRAADQAAPEECCGLLIGTAGAIRRAWPARNVAHDPARRYDVDPGDHFAAVREARRAGLEVIGCYHSHPRSAAIPSPTDTAEALTDFLYVIAGREPGEGIWRLSAFRFEDPNFVPVALVSSP
jgi:desampylase